MLLTFGQLRLDGVRAPAAASVREAVIEFRPRQPQPDKPGRAEHHHPSAPAMRRKQIRIMIHFQAGP